MVVLLFHSGLLYTGSIKGTRKHFLHIVKVDAVYL